METFSSNTITVGAFQSVGETVSIGDGPSVNNCVGGYPWWPPTYHVTHYAMPSDREKALDDQVKLLTRQAEALTRVVEALAPTRAK